MSGVIERTQYILSHDHVQLTAVSCVFLFPQVEDFFAQYPEAGAGGRGRQMALGNIRTNIAWMKNNFDTISSWLDRNTEK